MCKREWKIPKKHKVVKLVVAWRCLRVFVAVPLQNAVVDSTVSFKECEDMNEALYYSSIFNYLAWFLKKNGYSFARTQLARPFAVIYEAGLTYPNKYSDKIIDITKKHLPSVIQSVKKAVKEARFKTADKYLFLPELVRMFEEIHEVLKKFDKCLCRLALEYGAVSKKI